MVYIEKKKKSLNEFEKELVLAKALNDEKQIRKAEKKIANATACIEREYYLMKMV